MPSAAAGAEAAGAFSDLPHQASRLIAMTKTNNPVNHLVFRMLFSSLHFVFKAKKRDLVRVNKASLLLQIMFDCL